MRLGFYKILAYSMFAVSLNLEASQLYNPLFVSKEFYHDLKAAVGPAPTRGSSQQRADEEQLRDLQQSRSPEECMQAEQDSTATLRALYGENTGILSAKEVQKFNPFFETVKQEVLHFTKLLKVDFPREKPFRYIPDLSPCIQRDITGSYPSEHSVVVNVYARLLMEFVPEKKSLIERRSMQLYRGRLLAGMQHPSDIDAAKRAADFLYSKLQRSSEFKVALNIAKDQDVILAR